MPHQADLTDSCMIRPAPREDGAGAPDGVSRRPEPGAGSAGRGAARRRLDLAAGTLEIDVTRVVVDGKVIESDGKTENAQHLLALDPLTLAVLKAHVEMLDRERKDLGPDYHGHGLLFC
jgi:hypothetical protein